MKLYNKTLCPDKILSPLLVSAGKSVGARTSEVVVKVTQGQNACSHGAASKMPLVYRWHLRSKRTKDPMARFSMVRTDGGFIEIVLPGNKGLDWYAKGDYIKVAKRFYKVAQHEWSHIRDFQNGTYRQSPVTPSGRRIKWRDRIEEQRACAFVVEAKEVKGVDDMILELAIWLEQREKG